MVYLYVNGKLDKAGPLATCGHHDAVAATFECIFDFSTFWAPLASYVWYHLDVISGRHCGCAGKDIGI
jgi:hypothetical protein